MQVTPETRVSALIEALPYIQKFRGHTIVIKYGGAAMEDASQVERLLGDIVFLEAVGINPVVVHGGGKAITQAMREAGLQARFVNSLRVTDETAIRIVEATLDGQVNPRIVETINRFQGNARGISGREIFVAERLGPQTENGETIDAGFVGKNIYKVHSEKIEEMVRREIVPVVSSLATDGGNDVLNVNADIAAAALAMALKASKLIYVSDVAGVMRDPTNIESLIPTITIVQSESLINEGIIKGGMIPKLRSAMEALKQGVGKIHFLSGSIPHGLLLEIFTTSGIGTEIID